MKFLKVIGVIFGVFAAFVSILVVIACCKVSGDCSRDEELMEYKNKVRGDDNKSC